MKIYHGSAHKIEKPEFGKGKPYNDYGLGFYCTEARTYDSFPTAKNRIWRTETGEPFFKDSDFTGKSTWCRY